MSGKSKFWVEMSEKLKLQVEMSDFRIEMSEKLKFRVERPEFSVETSKKSKFQMETSEGTNTFLLQYWVLPWVSEQ